ncbi:hypothetical protein [Falsirhodobacter sp. 1013]|uniref:hypothetical protein n=1 Tax=Falsirhodobacter sp. 1013 TaxID=3417566 RepID=UPI003EB6EF4E
MADKVLFAGGSGVVGQRAAKAFRARHPDVPFLIGGRDLGKAEAIAKLLGNAEAVQIDTGLPRLGLEQDVPLLAIAMMVPDAGLHGMRLAQDLGIPYLSIGNWLLDVGAEMAQFIRQPAAAPIVLASHWHGGPTTFLALKTAQGLDSVTSIRIAVVVDDQDETGPAAIEDMDAGASGSFGVQAYEGGKRVWLNGDATRSTLATLDGRTLAGTAFAPYDIAGLAAATAARSIRMNLGMGASSSRLRRDGVGTEVLLDIEGEIGGQQVLRHSTFEFTKGQATLTGISTALSLSTVLGLEENDRSAPGLYFPETLMDPDWFLEQLRQAGATCEVGDGA